MNSEPTFEIFLGTYNASNWISKTLHALEKQTIAPFNVTIIDNGSTDGTISIIENIFQNYQMRNEYRLIHNRRNIGPISTFLDRLDLFDVDWIFMVHQDDYYHENHFEVLLEGIKSSSVETGLVFTAMQRMDENSIEIPSTPTLSSKLSANNRLENFMLTLQINPVNFPSCALKKSILEQIDTTRHTSAFNDTELILRMMCISDVTYVAKETMHYRIHQGNAHALTKVASNDYAVFIGLNELFHSPEFELLLNKSLDSINFEEFLSAVSYALEIHFSDEKLRNLSRGLIAEFLIRKVGYKPTQVAEFIKDAHVKLNLENEQGIITNLNLGAEFQSRHLASNENTKVLFTSVEQNQFNNPENLFIKIGNKVPIQTREKTFNFIFTNFLGKFFKRPFARVWYRRGKN